MNYNLKGLEEKFDRGEEIEFLFFYGHRTSRDYVTRACLSQWYPCKFSVGGIEYNCAEQWMMAEKARCAHDEESLGKILASDDPKTIKALGRKVKNLPTAEWNHIANSVVVLGNIHKFGQNPELLRYLFWTGDRVLVEASPTDKRWGIGMSSRTEGVENPHNWHGHNRLGFSIMAARDFLKEHGPVRPNSRIVFDSSEDLDLWQR